VQCSEQAAGSCLTAGQMEGLLPSSQGLPAGGLLLSAQVAGLEMGLVRGPALQTLPIGGEGGLGPLGGEGGGGGQMGSCRALAMLPVPLQ
jgi:hypothetical protein